MAYEESSCFFSFSESAIRWIQSKKSIDEKQWSHQGVSKDIDTEKRLISETVDTLCLVYLYMRPCVCVCRATLRKWGGVTDVTFSAHSLTKSTAGKPKRNEGKGQREREEEEEGGGAYGSFFLTA